MEILLKLPSSYPDKEVEQAVSSKGYYKIDFAVIMRIEGFWKYLCFNEVKKMISDDKIVFLLKIKIEEK
ncbi:hypothetical protein [Peribacillus simplex]|uniref:hypothetical protein n=1 Tax=Peribacillus simplex TaxID=1478 RepID=UPI00366D7029